MRAWFGILTIVFAAGAVFATDVGDLGVPTGWKASEYDNRGFDLLNKGDYENARKYLSAAIRIEPDRWSAYYNRAMTFYQEKKWAAALQDLNSTIRLKPSFVEPSFLRAEVNTRLGNYRASLSDLNVLIQLAFRVGNTAEQSRALNQRAWIRSVCPDPSIRNGQLAIVDAKKACELLKWKDAQRIDTLAAAYAEARDFDSAIRYEEQAISVSKSQPDDMSKLAAEKLPKPVAVSVAKKIAEEIKQSSQPFPQRLELYKHHRPCRETLR